MPNHVSNLTNVSAEVQRHLRRAEEAVGAAGAETKICHGEQINK